MKRLVLLLIILTFFGEICLSDSRSRFLSDSLFAKGVELYQQNRYKEAVPFFEKSDAIDKATLDSTSNRRGYSSMWLASCYFHSGDTAKARKLYRYYTAAPVDRRETVAIDSLQQSADDYLVNNEYGKAQPLYSQVLEFYETNFEAPRIEVAQMAYLAGMCFYMQKDLPSAIPYLEKASASYDKLSPSCSPEEQLFCYMRLIECLYHNKEYEKIGAMSRSFIQLFKTAGDKNMVFMSPLSIIAAVAYDKGNPGLTVEADEILCDALRYNKLDNSEEYCQIVSDLSYLYFKNRDYKNALPYSKEFYAINCKKNGENDKSNLYLLRKISASSFFMSNYIDAVKYEEKALKLAELYFGKSSSEYATSLLNLSQFQNYNGNYAEAIDCIRENISILKNSGKAGSVDYATSISFLSNYYSNVGRTVEALELNETAADIFLKEEGIKSPNYIRSLNNLSVNYSWTGDDRKAYTTGLEASRLALSEMGENNPDYLNAIANLANYSMTLGKYAEADSLFRKALDLASLNIGKRTVKYSTVLSGYAALKSVSGDFSSARKLQRESAEITKAIVGEGHIDYIRSLQGLAILNFGQNTDEMVKLTTESTRLLKKYMKDNFFRLNVNERLSLWHSNSFDSWFMIMIPAMDYYHNHDCEELAAMDYDAALLSKNYLLNIEKEISDIVYKSNNAELLKLYETLQSGNINAEKRDSLESKMNSSVADYVKIGRNFIGWNDVRKSLKGNDVAIEFRIAPIRNDSIMYCALVLTKKEGRPKLVPLFENNEIKKILPEDYYSTAKISTLVWKPLEKYIKDAENIYFSADAIFNNIAIESVPHWELSDPVSNLWNIYRLSSTGELIRNSALKKKTFREVSLYGGIKYDTSIEAMARDSRKYQSDKIVTTDRAIADSLNLRAGIAYLPATKEEVDKINILLKKRTIGTEVLTDTTATEGSFKALSGKLKDIIHVATHGFYWTDSEARRLNSLSFLQSPNGSLHRSDEDKALSRSGLLLAGANNALTGRPLPENTQDGILTAKEISELNMSGVDMVVLSACQTGLGEVTGDGVFGLQRGFKKAGVNTLLMSLWKVDDRATQMLMTRFYEYFLSGKSKIESLTLAQKYVREYEEEIEISDDENMTASQRRKSQRRNEETEPASVQKRKIRPFEDPKYWAAFVLLDALN